MRVKNAECKWISPDQMVPSVMFNSKDNQSDAGVVFVQYKLPCLSAEAEIYVMHGVTP